MYLQLQLSCVDENSAAPRHLHFSQLALRICIQLNVKLINAHELTIADASPCV